MTRRPGGPRELVLAGDIWRCGSDEEDETTHGGMRTARLGDGLLRLRGDATAGLDALRPSVPNASGQHLRRRDGATGLVDAAGRRHDVRRRQVLPRPRAGYPHG